MTKKLFSLRALLTKYNIDGYIIPRTDEYQNEYTPECANRLEYITGFKGSSGIAIITQTAKWFWTDGRYILQATKELPNFTLCSRDFSEVGNARIGYNPMLFTRAQLDILSKKLELIPIEHDLIDQIWPSKPPAPKTEVYLYDVEYAGKEASAKLAEVRENLSGDCLITSPDSICWLLNIRASDIEHVPVMLCYTVISANKATVFTEISRIPDEVRKHLDFVEFKHTEEIFATLKSLSKIQYDPSTCPVAFVDIMQDTTEAINPCLIPKSCKNDVEIEYAKKGHIKDAVALCEGLAWAQKIRDIETKDIRIKKIKEYDICLKLTEIRKKQDGYVMDSFHTIAAFKENGAIVHYRPTSEDSKLIDSNGLLLIDSGAHYMGCTTDVTRVITLGPPTIEQKTRYTQVLKGHIALAQAKFPENTFGSNLDILTRQYLWDEGLDYAHGTGHGVGNMLSVHESPGGYIGQVRTTVPMKAGMISSNEPGFYKNGEFGIRIENLMFTKQAQQKGFLEFEMLTLVPYARNLIDFDMMTPKEMKYLQEYYEKIRKSVLPLLPLEAKIWCEYEIDAISQIKLRKCDLKVRPA